MNPTIKSCSVRILRSFDYSHFEVMLGTNGETPIALEQVDALRKDAARLADKAVEQYKIAKAQTAMHEQYSNLHSYDALEAKRIQAKAKGDRTPEEAASLKAYQDAVFRANRKFDYEDDWEDAQ